jgi:hypothetical protein
MTRAALAALITTLALAAASPAVAYWTAGGTGAAFGASDTLDAGNQPSGLTSGSTVTVSWTQTVFHGLPLGGYPNGGYVVRRYPAAGGAPVTPGTGCDATITGGSATLSCSESGVPAGSWQYTVQPVLGSWTGAESLKSTVVAVAPAGPDLTAVTAQNPGAGQATGAIAISWASVPGTTGYNVYRRTSSGSYDYTAPLNGATPVGTTSYTDPGPGLAGGTTYDYVVRAIATGAESANSNERSATAIGRPAPPASASATAVAAGQISVSWPTVANAAGYNIYRRLSTGAYDFATPLNGATPATAASFTDTTAVNGSTYRYVIRSIATGAGGAPLESLTSSPESNAATSDALAPTGLAITDPGSPLRGTITLSGTATDSGSGVASVQMQYAPAGTTTWTTACADTTSPYSCGFNTAAIPDGLYDLRVLATDVVGNGAASPVVAARRIDNTGPAVSVNDPGANLRGTVTISAFASDPGTGVASVTIQRAPTGSGAWTTVCTDVTSGYSCSLNTTTLTDGGYDFRAIATDVAGNSTTSAILANRLVDNSGPTAVSIVTADGGGTAAKPDPGDTISYTFSEVMSPASLLAGWSGAQTTVTVRFTNGNPDMVTVWDATNTTQTALGSIKTGKKYVTGQVLFTGSSMVMSGNTVLVTLGTPNGATDVGKGNVTLQWTPSTAATDLAGNPLAAATISEVGKNTDF